MKKILSKIKRKLQSKPQILLFLFVTVFVITMLFAVTLGYNLLNQEKKEDEAEVIQKEVKEEEEEETKEIKIDSKKLPLPENISSEIKKAFENWNTVGSVEYKFFSSDGDEVYEVATTRIDFVDKEEKTYFNADYLFDSSESYKLIRDGNKAFYTSLDGEVLEKTEEFPSKYVFVNDLIVKFENWFTTSLNKEDILIKTEELESNGEKVTKYIFSSDVGQSDINYSQMSISIDEQSNIMEIEYPNLYAKTTYEFNNFNKDFNIRNEQKFQKVRLIKSSSFEEIQDALKKWENYSFVYYREESKSSAFEIKGSDEIWIFADGKVDISSQVLNLSVFNENKGRSLNKRFTGKNFYNVLEETKDIINQFLKGEFDSEYIQRLNVEEKSENITINGTNCVRYRIDYKYLDFNEDDQPANFYDFNLPATIIIVIDENLNIIKVEVPVVDREKNPIRYFGDSQTSVIYSFWEYDNYITPISSTI
ncbi:hypothetical protein GF362_00380 [Candidatus Dojkabacteria bacterium]|nr:hypothetical protein [Candidatus Dojkabacteria bacterium]